MTDPERMQLILQIDDCAQRLIDLCDKQGEAIERLLQTVESYRLQLEKVGQVVE